MNRHSRSLARWFYLLVIPLASCGASGVDPALVGTWQLSGAPVPIYWDIRANGTYEVSGPGAGSGHAGSFATDAGTWALRSETWGNDGGSYQLLDSKTFTGVGKLGPGTWVRVATSTAATPASTEILLATQLDQGQPLPIDVPELLAHATSRAREWRADAVPESIEFRIVNAPNPKVNGPEVRISFYSPSGQTGTWVTIRESGAAASTVSQPVRAGRLPLPAVFVDLPVAVRAARENGMRGSVNLATLSVWAPGGEPVLAWMLGSTGPGNGRTIDATTGQILEGDVTGYIAQYNAQWQRAAAGLRALMSRSRTPASANGVAIDPSVPGSTTPYDDGSQARAEYERNAAEARAYWGGSASDYSRIKNGECTSSDASRFGC